MSTMTNLAHRDRFMRQLEDFLNDPANRAANRLALRNAMTMASKYTEGMIAAKVIDPNNPAHAGWAEHLDQHWLGGSSDWRSWWPHKENKDEVMRLGAIEMASVPPALSIRLLWLCAGDYFARVMLSSPEQVTVITLTPPIPDGHRQPASTLQEQGIEVILSSGDAQYVFDTAERYEGRPKVEDARVLSARPLVYAVPVFSAP